MRSCAALSRLLVPSASRSLPAAGSLSALWQGGARSFNSKASGDDSIVSHLYHTPWLEEEERQNAFARDADGLVSTAKLHSNVGNGSVTKALWSPRTALWAPVSCGCCGHNNQMRIPKWVTRSPAEDMRRGSSVIQSNMYASSSRFEDKAKIRALMEARGLKKEPGWSRIEIQGQLNTFLVDDKSHPRNKEIREELQRMLEVMKDAGYVADLRCVLRDIPESEKEQALQHHSERLAMALGHISLPSRAPMRIIKNLRVCNDCHVATKYFAYIYKREIIVRDATRFHHFREGYCSCGDYW